MNRTGPRLTHMTRHLAVLVALLLGAFALTPAPAQANESTASPYAFQAAPGCLGLHTGVGIDGYDVDGVFYDVPDTNEVRTIKFSHAGGLQGDYRVRALPSYTASNADGAQWVQVAPGEGCAAEVAPKCAEQASHSETKAVRKLQRQKALVRKLRRKLAQVRDRA